MLLWAFSLHTLYRHPFLMYLKYYIQFQVREINCLFVLFIHKSYLELILVFVQWKLHYALSKNAFICYTILYVPEYKKVHFFVEKESLLETICWILRRMS